MIDPRYPLTSPLPPSPKFQWGDFFLSLLISIIEGWVAYAIYERTHASSFAEIGAIAICAWGVILFVLGDLQFFCRKLSEDLLITRTVVEAHLYGDKALEAQKTALQIKWSYENLRFHSVFSFFLRLAIIGFGVYLYYRG